MRPPFSILMITLLAFGWTSLAAAESAPGVQSHAPVPALNDLSLDNAFEQATSPKREQGALGGPTLMDCKNGTAIDGLEVCVVTIDGLFASIPAALAPR